MTAMLTVSPTQWAKYQDIDDVPPLNEGDYECLAAVRDVLKLHGKLERFGVALLHKHFDLADDEMLVETTNKEGRVLNIRPVKAEQAGSTVETIWELGEGVNPVLGCRQYCDRDVQGNHNSFHRQT